MELRRHMASNDSKSQGDFQYTPLTRFRDTWRMAAGLLPIFLLPIIYKYQVFPDLRHDILRDSAIGGLVLLILYARMYLIRKNVYRITVDEEGLHHWKNGVLVSAIRWSDVKKVHDATSDYIKLFSNSQPPITVEFWMSVYTLTKRYVAKTFPAEKVWHVRFWKQPIKFGRKKTIK